MQEAVIYVWVSTARQATDGVSLDSQLSRARKWCEAHGHPIASKHKDAGISGAMMRNRPALKQALDEVCKRRGVLVVYSLSRLCRSTKDAIAISERLNKCGADLCSLSEDINTATAAGKMVFKMLAVLAEFERDLVSERTCAALAHKRSNGYAGRRQTPFGYDVDDDGRLHKNTAEQGAIRLAQRLRRNGWTLWGIADELTRQGIKTKRGKAKWYPAQVRNILAKADRAS